MGKLQTLITKIKQTPMSVGALKKVLPRHSTFKLLSQLTEHRSALFKNHRCIVVLIPSDFSKLGHFVVLTAFPKYIEYFSSLGGSPVKETQKLGQDGTTLMKLLGKNYTYNSKPLQAPSTKILLAGAQRTKLKPKVIAAIISYEKHYLTGIARAPPNGRRAR